MGENALGSQIFGALIFFHEPGLVNTHHTHRSTYVWVLTLLLSS